MAVAGIKQMLKRDIISDVVTDDRSRKAIIYILLAFVLYLVNALLASQNNTSRGELLPDRTYSRASYANDEMHHLRIPGP